MNTDIGRVNPFVQVAHEAGVPKPDAILECESISRTFGGLKAVDVDRLAVQRGVITALIGPNGAGKTTFFNLISGFDRPDTGRWSFDGDDLGGVKPYMIARRGMVRTFQLTKALARLTVIENMRLGATGQAGESVWKALVSPLWRDQEREITERADHLLERFNLMRVRNDYAGELSGGQRKLLEMARALMSRPQMVLLDEPTAGVNPALKQSLLEHIRGLLDDGTTVMFVEHDMDMVRDISDWVVVMGEGKVIAEGTHETIGRNTTVIDAYLGSHHDQPLSFEDEEATLAEADRAIEEESA